jgi:hypothetical protein
MLPLGSTEHQVLMLVVSSSGSDRDFRKPRDAMISKDGYSRMLLESTKSNRSQVEFCVT